VLPIKKASSFGIEFKTNEKNGIIFYVDDDRDRFNESTFRP
jgi:hypothetical protein